MRARRVMAAAGVAGVGITAFLLSTANVLSVAAAHVSPFVYMHG